MANRIKELRKKKGLTLDGLADKSGIKRGTLNNYELGKTEPKLATWERLADALGVSVGYLQGIDKYVLDTDSYFSVLSEQLKKARSSAKSEQLLKFQSLHDLDTMEAAGWKYEAFLNDKQIDTLLSTISNVYDSWLAYDNQKRHQDPKIDEFFSTFENLTSELNTASLGLYMNDDESEYDIDFQDLINTITPAVSALKHINKKISQRKSNQ